MAASDELGSLTRAFSVASGAEAKFQKRQPRFFVEDERQFERWDDRHILQLRHEFLRLKDAIVLWTMHPWERDARLLKESLYKGPQYNVLVEIACLVAPKSCWVQEESISLPFDHSIEEDVAFHVHGPERKLLVGLLSSYRYEGPKVNVEVAKFEAKALSESASKKSLIEDEELVRILSTRSKLHLKAIYKHYKEISVNYLDEDLDGDSHLVKEAVQCLCAPQAYFSQVLDTSLRYDVDEITKEAVTRVIVTRSGCEI
ncbi:hypothetical protein DH2020_002884 [Rehmannia glutinosa]|uniref:Uncharacterized protein n=1 Tax=Rehmannia glutinosa TaxID=99300 RepID=A0ABR0XVD6_REHGL